MEEDKQLLENLAKSFQTIKNHLSINEKRQKIIELEAKSLDVDLWKDADNAKEVLRGLSDLKKELEEVEKLEADIKTLVEMSEANLTTDDFTKEVERVTLEVQKLELKSFLSGPYDDKNALVSLHAGQGGSEAMDWASMLFRMYMRYAERKGWATAVLDYTAGEEAGIKSVTFKVNGSYAYGYLKSESGAHRLVRQSPFNADKLRQTSFALVEVLPELEEKDFPDMQIKDEDLEVQFFRSSSQGGQNVQKVSTAVRLTHKPTGIAVTAQSERFQEQNRKIALNLLRSKLWIRQKEMEKETKQGIKGEYKPASWGNQIRSYVLHPYKMVKDLRTEVESSNAEAVLDGEIDNFIEAELKATVA